MSTLIPTTPAANKSTEPHQEPSEQDSFNHLLYKVLRLTSQQVQDLNGWMEHHGIPNIHEVIAQNYHKPHTLEDKLKFITQSKTCYIQFNVMISLSLVITYIRHRRYSTKSKYFGPFYYIQIDPQHYDEWRVTPPEEEIHFSWPNDEDEYQNLFSDDNQVIQQENSCSEPPEPLSYSVFQSHFQGSSTSNTQKILLPKPTWEKPSKDQQQMIIDHNLNSGSPHLSTSNKSPSPAPHLPTPQQTAKPQQVHTHQSDESTTDTIKTETTPSDPLLAMAHQSINTSDDADPDISNVLSVKRSSQIQVCQYYPFQHANHTNQQLVDHGANEGLAGPDMRGIHRTYRKIKIQDIDNHEVADLDVVTAATLLNTTQGKVTGIFNEYAYLWKGSSIPSSGQLEWLQIHDHATSVKVGGTQLINTLDGYSVPLLIEDGLVYATSLGRLTNLDMDTYPHVSITSPDEWDHSQVPDQFFGHPMSDACGDFNKHIIVNLNTLLEAPPRDCGSDTEISSVFSANLHQSSPQEPDWNSQRPFLAWTSTSSIKDTFNVTTRHETAPNTQDYIKHPFKPRNPVFSIPRCSEDVGTDTIFSETPAVDDGSTMTKFFYGHDTFACDTYGIKSTKQFISTLSSNTRKWGAMITLTRDGGTYDISKGVTNLPHSLFIQDFKSEPYHQHQNKVKNRFGHAKHYPKTVMNTSGCPACSWLFCLQCICVVLNYLASIPLQGICPVQALQGTTPDISFMPHTSFYEPVYYRIEFSEPDFHLPSSSNEKKGYWVGFAANQGDSLTWRTLTEDTHMIILCSGIQSVLSITTNQCLASPSGEGTTLPFPIPYPQQSQLSLPLDPLDEFTPNSERFVNSQSGEDEDNPIPMANIDIPNVLGRSFLLPPEDNGEHHMSKIINIDDHGQPLEDLKIKLQINKDQAEEIMSYNQLMDYILRCTDEEEDQDSLFKFRDIVAHQSPLEPTNPNHKRSKYNVMVEWGSGEVTLESLPLISKDNPVTCTLYAKKHDLLDTTRSKRLIRAVKQSRIHQVRASARYQHSFQISTDYNHAIRPDKKNSNTHWQDTMDLESSQIHEHKVFKDTVNLDDRSKERLVTDGHLTKEPGESIYSGVVSLRSLRMVVFLPQLNNLEIWGADVNNAYPEAYTDEKLCIIAGPELKELQGHFLTMVKALYGTHSGGARWHDRLFDILQELSFKPSQVDHDVWTRPEPGGTCYEYLAVYVDDLAIAAKDPQAFYNELKKRYNLKLKGAGPLEYHLGCTHKKDSDGTLATDPRRYVNKILESYERMFKEKPGKSRPPLEGGDHPELDTSELCDEQLISLGHFDIAFDEACTLDTSCDYLLHLDSPSLSPELQYNSSVDSVEIEFLPESEGHLDHTKNSPTDLFSTHHDYELFLLQKELDAPNNNLNHYNFHTCENQDDILIHTTNLRNIFALPQFMAQHTCDDQEPTDDPIAVPTASQASCDHTLKPKCAHNPIDIPVQWFKFIHLIPKPRMTKTPFQIAVHKAYSPIAPMNYKWTINLHDGHPLFQVMKQEGYTTPKRIVGYLLFQPDGAIRFRTGEPDFSSLKDQEYDVTKSIYSGTCEQIPHDIPKPLGKHAENTYYVDANLHHDLATGKAVTASLHFLNQTPIDAYSKRHHLISYHRDREVIPAKIISFHWKDGKSNPADILSKHWEFATVWPMLKPILFWRGETATQLKGSDRIPSTTPGAEPPRDTKDSGSARSHSTHLETSSSDRPKWSPTRSSTRYQDQISVTCTRWTLRMPSFARATHAQPSLSNFTRRDSIFGERTRSRGTTLGERNFPTSPQNKKTKLTHCSIYVPMRTISTSHAK